MHLRLGIGPPTEGRGGTSRWSSLPVTPVYHDKSRLPCRPSVSRSQQVEHPHPMKEVPHGNGLPGTSPPDPGHLAGSLGSDGCLLMHAISPMVMQFSSLLSPLV